MTSKTKIALKLCLTLVIWVIVGNAYWMAKERSVSECFIQNIDNASRYVEPLFRDDHRLFERARDQNNCSLAEGNGHAWNHILGLAYWEVMLTLPIAYRYRFN